MSPRRLVELTPAERRRALGGAAVRSSVTFAALIAVYYAIPLVPTNLDAVGLALVGLAGFVFVAALVWQVRRILRADIPALRAVEAVAVIIPVFLCGYAAVYVVMSESNAAQFTEPLTKSAALYFSIVIFGTVGFGDIAPTTDATRLVVSSQILCGLIFIGIVLRLLLAVSKFSLRRVTLADDDDADD